MLIYYRWLSLTLAIDWSWSSCHLILNDHFSTLYGRHTQLFSVRKLNLLWGDFLRLFLNRVLKCWRCLMLLQTELIRFVTLMLLCSFTYLSVRVNHYILPIPNSIRSLVVGWSITNNLVLIHATCLSVASWSDDLECLRHLRHRLVLWVTSLHQFWLLYPHVKTWR